MALLWGCQPNRNQIQWRQKVHGTYHHFRELQKVHVSNKVLQMTVLEMRIKFRAKPWRHVAPQWPHYRSASGWLLRRLEMVCNTCRSVAWLVPQVTVAKIASSMLCDNSKHMGLSENVGQKPFHPLVNHNFPYQRCHTSDVHPLISNKPSHGYESKPLKNLRYLLIAIGFGCLIIPPNVPCPSYDPSPFSQTCPSFSVQSRGRFIE
jgi:hypothetical protein